MRRWWHGAGSVQVGECAKSGWLRHGVKEKGCENLISVGNGPSHAVSQCYYPAERHWRAHCVAHLFPRELFYGVYCGVFWETHKSGGSSGVKPCIGRDVVRRDVRAVRWFVNGCWPKTNPRLFEVLLGSRIRSSDAWCSDPWESDVLHARFGGDCIRCIHSGNSLWRNCEEVLSMEIYVMQVEDSPVLHGDRRDG